MYNTNKSLSIWSLVVGLGLFVLTVFASSVNADENYGNLPPDPNMMMNMEAQESINLPFDPNDYTFLVYNPGGQEASIETAMDKVGIHNYHVRDSAHEVTPEDLATHDILIVGWNYLGDTNGLHSDDLAAGINGRVILTGHDLDLHTVRGIEAAQTMLIQAIDYVLAGDGTGLITLGCSAGFPYLPKQNWDVNAQTVSPGGEYVTEFTPYGLASGVFDGLQPSNMSYNGSYHNKFTINSGSAFVPFEIGESDANITVDRASIYPLKLIKTEDANAGRVKLGGRLTYTINYNYPNNLYITRTNSVS